MPSSTNNVEHRIIMATSLGEVIVSCDGNNIKMVAKRYDRRPDETINLELENM